MATKRFGTPRPAGEPSGSTERKVRILLEIIRNRSVRVSRIREDYDMSERSVLRDFQELRKIGKRAGFTLSEKIENGVIRLEKFDARPTSLDKSGKALRALIQDAARALGKPVENELVSLAVGEAVPARIFLRFVMPTLVEGTRVAEVFKTLESAWAMNARVKFRYTGKERRVEPYDVLQRSGRYYLLARDADEKCWRRFALDRIEGSVVRAGTFTPVEIPEGYSVEDVLGWIKGDVEHAVAVWLSPALAPSATSRTWQREQRTEQHADGSATMTFTVSDTDEVIRWSLGFGADAKVVSPGGAVQRAKALLFSIVNSYNQ